MGGAYIAGGFGGRFVAVWRKGAVAVLIGSIIAEQIKAAIFLGEQHLCVARFAELNG